MYPQGRCVYVPTSDPTSRADFEQVDPLWTPVTTTTKYLQILTYEDGCHSCELQNTSRHALSCFMYPQGRSECLCTNHAGTQRHAQTLNTVSTGGVTTTY